MADNAVSVGSPAAAAASALLELKMKVGRKKCRRPQRFSDPLIIPRVKKYLADNVDKAYVDVTLMSRALRDRYREYGMRNENNFYQMVEAAYNVVLQSYGLDQPSTSSDSDDESDDLEVLDDGDALNDRLTLMYQQNKKPAKREHNSEIDKTSELIDISSDEGSEGESVPKSLKLNNQITIETSHTPSEFIPAEPHKSPNISVTIEEERPLPDPDITPRKRKTAKRMAKPTPKIEAPQLRYTSKVSFDDVGGINHIMEQLCDLVLHMKHPEVYAKLGIKAPRGALLHGPPGTGKTLLAHAIAGRLKLPIISTVATELVGGMSGESEKLIRDTFVTATALAPCILFIDEIDSICGNRLNAQKDMERRMVSQLLSSIDSLDENNTQILLLAATNNPDSLDPGLRRAGRLEQEIPLGIPTLASRKDILRILCRKLNLDPDVDLNVVAQLTPGYVGADLQALINKSCTIAVKRVFKFIKDNPRAEPSETNNVESVINGDENAPTPVVENGEVPASDNKVNGENTEQAATSLPSVDEISQNDKIETNNYTNEAKAAESDNVEIDKSAQSNAVQQNDVTPQEKKESVEVVVSDDLQKYLDDVHPFTPEQLSNMKITQQDIANALKTTKPCAIREGFATVPDITWEDIGSLIDVRRELQLAVLAPVKYPDQLDALGLSVPSGVLLCGPPGCGKTLLAKAVANEAGINFISVKGPELLNMYVGESERAVRTCFSRAKNSAPCVIFFDEFDSLCPKRSNSDNSGASRVVNQLLTEMDGVEGREGVFVLAASNRPDIIDPAVLRPGRLDRILFVGMPLLQDRVDILRAITKKGSKPPLSSDVDLEVIAKATDGFTGADLAGLVRQAATQALTDFITGNIQSGQLAVGSSHFQVALSKTRPSVSPKELQHYEKLRLKYASLGDEKIDVDMDMSECMDIV